MVFEEEQSMSIVGLKNVSLRLGGFHLRIHEEFNARVTGLFGPSGAGKTTLLEIIAGLRGIDQGALTLGPETVNESARNVFVPTEKRRVGYVPQDLALFPHKTVKQNLLFGARKTEEPSSLLKEVLSVLELENLLERFPENLSGGEKQRVALGRALMSAPRLLLLDEPLSSVDSELKERVSAFIAKTITAFKIPVIYVSHDSSELAGICDEVFLLNAGKIQARGKFEDIFEKRQRIDFVLRTR
jgi:molybdate transport system ATP-binding protein